MLEKFAIRGRLQVLGRCWRPYILRFAGGNRQ